jgi:branched-chain amino acid transport system permease protein
MAAVLAQTRGAVADAVREARAAWTTRATAGVAVVAAAALLPVVPLDLGFDRLTADLYLGAAAVSLGIAVGLGGMPSLGHGAFVALGAFGAALLRARSGWPAEAAIVAGALIATVAGAALGLVVGYLRPALVAVLTWLVAWLVALSLVAFPSVSGGAQGIALEERFSTTVHYELGVALVALAVLTFVLVARSCAGIALAAARERRPFAETLGVPVARLRAGAFTAGAGIAGLAGALAVQLAGVGDASAYGPLLSVELFVAVVLGGAVSPAGGLVGVGVLVLLERVSELGNLEGLQANRIETVLAAVIVLSVLGATDRGLLPSLSGLVRRRRNGLESGERSFAARPIKLPPPVVAPALQARGLTKRFGPIMALEGLDLDLCGGTVHAVIGPNGSGKTTALRVLSGAVAPDAGSIAVGGDDIGTDDLRARADRGIVGTLQSTAVFSELTGLENALVGAHLRLRHGSAFRAVFATPKARAEARSARRAALSALEIVGLGSIHDVLAGELPGAAQRRLMIAAALATQPRVLLLDEPAAGASRTEVDLLAELVGALRASGLAILLVDHNLRLVRRVADRVTVLEAGRAIASGALEDVVENEAVLRAYLGGHRV